MNSLLQSAALGAVSGFLTRPCCVLPAALSVTGVSLAAYRGPLLGASAVLMGVSLWINFRREGGWFNRLLAVCGAAVAFAFAAGVF
ncbi:MAG: hypothetical protein ABR589_10785 [Chthoniobacterales bacterium]